ncbi:MAG: ribonuclease H [Sulfurimonas sp.]|nr:ribonuclease H [Sulfurimonas sp.]
MTNANKPKLFLFTDASADAKTKVAYGAYILLDEDALTSSLCDVKTKRFEETTSSKVELQTLLWALSEINSHKSTLVIYTDCQNTIGLIERRKRLEKNNYITGANTPVRNQELYKEFYKIIETIDYEFVKIKGHKKKEDKNALDKIFTLVDKASRNALREGIKQQ